MRYSEYQLQNTGSTTALTCNDCVFHNTKSAEFWRKTCHLTEVYGHHVGVPDSPAAAFSCQTSYRVRLINRLTDQEVNPEELYREYKIAYNAKVLASGLVGATHDY